MEKSIKNSEKAEPKHTFFNENSVTVIVAIIGITGSLIATAYKGVLDLEIKKKEIEQALIMKAVENNDLDQSRKNLEFFIKSGFISDPEGKILKLVQDTVKQSIPVIPTTVISQSDAPYVIVASSDNNIIGAKNELDYVTGKLNLPANLYKRNGYYCVIIGNYDSREIAKPDLLLVQQKRFKTAYISSLPKWCSSPSDKNGYFECK